jgi:hypothetical protein
MGPLPIVPDELVSGIRNVRAQGSEEIECGIGKSACRVSAGTAVMILGGIDGDVLLICRGYMGAYFIPSRLQHLHEEFQYFVSTRYPILLGHG